MTPMAYEKLTARACSRMLRVLRLRRAGQTLGEIGRKLKVTRERVRQVEKMARHLFLKD
jgi:DNA-directed RNA polymerase sigma subunit (sigma70/sigma32)